MLNVWKTIIVVLMLIAVGLSLPLTAHAQTGLPEYEIQSYGDGIWYSGIYLADMTGDDAPEILIGNRNSRSVEIWQYQSGSGLLRIDSIAFSSHIHDIKAADFDGDGAIDVVVGLRSSGLFYASNTGTPGSVGSWGIRQISPGYTWQVLVEDFDNDGKLDISQGVDYGPIRIFYGNGAGEFTQGVAVSDPASSIRFPRGFNAIDLNNDDLPDLVGVDGVYMRAFLNPGSRSAAWPSVGIAAPLALYPYEMQANLQPSAADLDGNGVIDQVAYRGTPSSSGLLEVLMFRGENNAGVLQWNTVVVDTITDASWAGHAAVADLNEDGFADICLGGGTKFNGLRVYLGDSSGTFTLETIDLDHGSGDYLNNFVVGDINGDAHGDIVMGRYTGARGLASGFEVLYQAANDPPVLTWHETPAGSELVNTTLTATASFSDADPSDTHICVWDWGDGTIADPFPCTPGTMLSSSHGYASVGEYEVSISVTDTAGAADTLSTSVRVIFPFTGFLPPLSNPPDVNAVKAGRAIPVKFSLGGDWGLDIFADGYPLVWQTACTSGDGGSAPESAVSAGASGLHYDPYLDQYIYVWKTDKAWKDGCRQLTIKLTDGTEHSAVFDFGQQKIRSAEENRESAVGEQQVFLPFLIR